MSTYEPGTVAVATVRGVPNVRVFRLPKVHDFHVYRWQSAVPIGESVSWKDEDVTDVRPLVVLDLDAYEFACERPLPAGWLRAVADRAEREGGASPNIRFVRWLADQIEAQVAPPRIPEPGLWGVVEARVSTGGAPRRWTRDGGDRTAQWVALEATMRREWSALIDPVLIRDGIEDES